MLTADLVQVRRRGDLLSVPPLSDDERARAFELAEAFLGLARAHVGQPRATLTEALRSVPVAGRERKLAMGVQKLLIDKCAFEEEAAVEPAALRAELFSRATARRKALGPHDTFDRAALLEELARERDVIPEALDRALYADLPDAQILRVVNVAGPRALAAAYEAARVQAVLLRAVKVVARVRDAAPATYRQLFRKLKFLRLLHRITRLEAPEGKTRRGGHGTPAPGYLIEIDGPYSLFESVTKYGLQLALAYPHITACDEWSIEADLRWGHERRPARLLQKGGRADDVEGRADVPAATLPDEVADLLARLEQADAGFRAKVGSEILDLPGVGHCVPDLELIRTADGARVFVEVLGYWSRDAVWRRVELVERGLDVPIIFVVSKHLRVSEAALPETLPAALLVYARTISASALLERAEMVLNR